jgi:hypothetical protein
MAPNEDRDTRFGLDRLAIVELLHRYSDSVTRGDLDHDEELFTVDAVVEIGSPFDARIEGAQAIREWRSNASAALELLIHTTYSPVVRLVGPGRAKATSQTREMVRSPGSTTRPARNVMFYSVYFDDLVKADDTWRFARRFGPPIYVESDTLTGYVHATRPVTR